MTERKVMEQMWSIPSVDKNAGCKLVSAHEIEMNPSNIIQRLLARWQCPSVVANVSFICVSLCPHILSSEIPNI